VARGKIAAKQQPVIVIQQRASKLRKLAGGDRIGKLITSTDDGPTVRTVVL